MTQISTFPTYGLAPRSPCVGDVLHCDDWPQWEWPRLYKSNGYSDSQFPGCQFRVPMGEMKTGEFYYHVAINITLTGKIRRIHSQEGYIVRCRVEFVGDGEPSEYALGWLRYNEIENPVN